MCTYEDTVKTNTCDINVSTVAPCNIEEADGRLLLHAKHSTESGHQKIMIRTVDSDVVVISIFAFHNLTGIQELWIDFGVGKSRKFIAVHTLAVELPTYIITESSFISCIYRLRYGFFF